MLLCYMVCRAWQTTLAVVDKVLLTPLPPPNPLKVAGRVAQLSEGLDESWVFCSKAPFHILIPPLHQQW